MGKKIDITESENELKDPKLGKADDDEEDLDDDNEDEDEDLDGDEDDDDEDEDEDEDDDEERAPKRKASKTKLNRNSDLADIKQTLADLRQQAASGGTKEEKQKVSKVTSLFQKLVADGYKKDQLQVLATLVESLKEDLQEEYDQKLKGKEADSFNKDCWRNLEREIDKYADEYPSVKWAKDSIMKRAAKLMESSSKFSDAQAAYQSGRVPAQSDFSRAAQRIVGTFLKESGIKKSASSDQLDVKSSRSKPSAAISKKGEVDTDKLSDFEREVYVTTMNVTKNKDLALDALKAVRGR